MKMHIWYLVVILLFYSSLSLLWLGYLSLYPFQKPLDHMQKQQFGFAASKLRYALLIAFPSTIFS